MTTIRDIAKLSGYSVSTVSRVINQQKYVSNTAKIAVQKVIDQLDYVPNDIARDLSSGMTKNIGVVLPHAKHPYFTQILNGVMAAAFKSNYRIVLLPSAYNEALELNYLEQLKRKAYRAIIFTSHGVSLDQLASYTKYGQIVCCENPSRQDISAVYSKREKGYIEAFSWLKEQQYKSFAFLFSRSVEISPTSSKTLAVFKRIFDRMPPR